MTDIELEAEMRRVLGDAQRNMEQAIAIMGDSAQEVERLRRENASLRDEAQTLRLQAERAGRRLQ